MFPLQLPPLSAVSIVITLILIAIPACCVLRARLKARGQVRSPAKHPAMQPAAGVSPPPAAQSQPGPDPDAGLRNQFVASSGPARWIMGRLAAPIPVETRERLPLTGAERAEFKRLAADAATDEAVRYHRAIVSQFLGRPIS
jgi:hypothetical protein